ncbi:hypothetical protein E3P99_02557 [Wallemia hederae]|uniref:Peptidase S9 prolyl oligopeptidase catalytic domain-containing protein n=1 Tax=Wallemia hederae TaxID=1540922 RepID=A0A4T0FNZ7_9BASI|nr:hypothetical protein E3P99_02557 [Wallemia hederae]
MTASESVIVVGGIKCTVYGLQEALKSPAKLDVAVVFMLHGRGESQKGDRYPSIANKCIAAANKHPQRTRNLILVSLDHRNHGSRLIDKLHNKGWPDNANHFMDMFAIQQGTSRDVSYLIDYLPAYLFPNDELSVVDFGCIGDHRISVGAPIIACADYMSLMEARAGKKDIALKIPQPFREQLYKYDPMLSFEHSKDAWKGKKIMALSGTHDNLVPPKHQVNFKDKLTQLYSSDSDAVMLWKTFDGVKHEVPDTMQDTCANFIADALIAGVDKEELLRRSSRDSSL